MSGHQQEGTESVYTDDVENSQSEVADEKRRRAQTISLLEDFEKAYQNNPSSHLEKVKNFCLKLLDESTRISVNSYPEEGKYRQISCDNLHLRHKLTDLTHGRSLLINVGFRIDRSQNVWYLPKEHDQLCAWALNVLEDHLSRLMEIRLQNRVKRNTIPLGRNKRSNEFSKEKETEKERLLKLMELDRIEREAEIKLRQAVTPSADNTQPMDSSFSSQRPVRESTHARSSSLSHNRIRTLYESNADGTSAQAKAPDIGESQQLTNKISVKDIFEGRGYKLSGPSTENIICEGTTVDSDFEGKTAFSVEGKPCRKLRGISKSEATASSAKPVPISPISTPAPTAAEESLTTNEVVTTKAVARLPNPSLSLRALRSSLEQGDSSNILSEGSKAMSANVEIPVPIYSRATIVEKGQEVSLKAIAPYWVSKIRLKKSSEEIVSDSNEGMPQSAQAPEASGFPSNQDLLQLSSIPIHTDS